MKYLYILFIFLNPFFHYSKESSACDNLYSKVTYALSHSNKALSATNFEHQMYYAERALIAMEKAEALRNDCGCSKAEDKTFSILKNLNKAIEPIDWDAGRFFTKKSKSLINELITALDECSMSELQKSDSEDDTTSKSYSEEESSSEAIESSSNLENQDLETLQLAKYISKVDKSLQAAEQELNRLLKTLNADEPKSSSAVELQKKMYVDRSKKLLQKTLEKLKTEN